MNKPLPATKHNSETNILLAIETANYGNSSVAIFNNNKFISQKLLSAGRNTSVELLPAVKSLLNNAGVKKVDIIAVDCGPGSFTGIRVGIAAAQGLADGWNAKIIGVSQFDFFENLTTENTKQLILIDARAGNGYYYELREFDKQKIRGFINKNNIIKKLIAPEEKVIICGDVNNELLNNHNFIHSSTMPKIDAKTVAQVAMNDIQAGTEKKVEAIYLHTTVKIPNQNK